MRIRLLLIAAFLLPTPAAAQNEILPGSSDLAVQKLTPRTWTIDIAMERDGQVVPVGRTRYAIEHAQAHWRLITSTTSEIGTATDTAVAMSTDLAPVRHMSYAVPRTLFLEFNGTKVTGRYEPKDGPARTVERTTDVPTFDAAWLEVLITLLPLEAGYAARLPVYIEEQNGLAWFDVQVKGAEEVNGTAAWVVSAQGPRMPVEFLIAKESREVLGGRAELPNGATIRMTRS